MSPRPLLCASIAGLVGAPAACGRSRASARHVFADSGSAALAEAGAAPRARHQRGNAFQRYLYLTRVDVQSQVRRRGRGAITSWLEVHGVESELR